MRPKSILFVSLLAVLALVAIRRQPVTPIADSHFSPRTPMTPAAVTVAPTDPVSKSTSVANRFVELMRAWANAENPRSDQIEEELKLLITDANVAAIVAALPSDFQNTHLGLLALERWAALDRPAATRWLSAQTVPSAWQASALTREWISRDTDGYLTEYLNTVPAGAWHDLLAEAMIRDSLAQQEPALAFELAQGLSSAKIRIRCLQAAVLQWSEWDARAALAHVSQLPDAATQERLIPHVAIGYAAIAPRAAADWLLNSLETGNSLDLGLTGVLQMWIRRHLAGARDAAEWASQLPAGHARDIALTVIREQTAQTHGESKS